MAPTTRPGGPEALARPNGRTLYTVSDIYSRYLPGSMLARAERGSLAEAPLEETSSPSMPTQG